MQGVALATPLHSIFSLTCMHLPSLSNLTPLLVTASCILLPPSPSFHSILTCGPNTQRGRECRGGGKNPVWEQDFQFEIMNGEGGEGERGGGEENLSLA